ncbi:FkbM family methyltransferase [Polynucleobacter sp. MWH-UH23A]|uniref:FkbM family methyltransferase n=1 Tax=Polynucleobacter sp. MWH-UH23A TaxID=1855613 RepID=UPI0033652B7F
MNKSYAYDGADLIIRSLLRDVENGFYVDLGANHPIDFSNTYGLYLSGWSGVAVDGNEKFIKLWAESRPRDIFLNALVSNEEKDVNYTIFSEDTLSSIDPPTVDRYKQRNTISGFEIVNMRTVTLQTILDSYANDKEVHLMSVDVEGEDFNVLKGFNFQSALPGCVVVEIKNYSLYDVFSNEIVRFMKDYGYSLICKTPLDSFFVYKDKPYFDWIPRTMLG